MLAIYIVTYVLMLSFFLIEKFVRKGDKTKTLEKTKSDRAYDKRSTNLLAFTFVTSYLLLIITPFLNHYKIGIFGTAIPFNVFGLVIMISGIAIRIVAVNTLGRFYTRTLKETEKHELVTNGIYKFIRHPGYLGNILLFLGACIALGNMISFSILAILVLATYTYRIKVEEVMLTNIFGDKYKAYIKTSKKLIPYIF